MRRSAFVLAVVSALALPPALLPLFPRLAYAQDAATVERAKMFFNAGAQAYTAGRFNDAVLAFEEAYRLSPLPAILFSMAQAERKQYFIDKKREHIDHALTHYREYLKQENAGRRSDAVEAVAELEPIASRLDAQGAPKVVEPPVEVVRSRLMVTAQATGAKATVDGAEPIEVPTVRDVAPGKHHVKIAAAGYYDEERDVVVQPGPIVPLDVTLKERPGQLVLDAPPGADISIDGRFYGTTPVGRPIDLASGTHFVALAKNGRRAFAASVNVERARSSTLKAEMPTTGQRVGATVVLVAGGVVVLAGGLFTVIALAQQSRAQRVLDDKAAGNLEASRLREYDDSVTGRDGARGAAFVAFGAGAVLVGTGALLYLFDKPSVALPPPLDEKKPAPKSTMDLAAAPVISPGAWGAVLGGRF